MDVVTAFLNLVPTAISIGNDNAAARAAVLCDEGEMNAQSLDFKMHDIVPLPEVPFGADIDMGWLRRMWYSLIKPRCGESTIAFAWLRQSWNAANYQVGSPPPPWYAG